ncbi:hypothetical protein B296_00014231 [Ensete ventricosum]|uniref:Uncharacterized protein n=1 Tax=Ensete ventricosum TaxID=4639 RepID=A0A427B4V1_ENSVE|nr:hypothetical protein B296_00014231 [Ensete ventricosum]
MDEDIMDDDKKTWLSSDTALAHFEALKLERKAKGDSGAAKDGMVLEESDENDKEVPLGKIMEILRSQGARKKKKKKAAKKDNLPSDFENIENEFDVLGVVREINLDNLEREQIMETGKSVTDSGCRSAKMTDKSNVEKDEVFPKRKHDGTSTEVVVSTPKRKRSSFMHRSNSAKGQKENRKISLSQSFAKDETAQSSVERSLYEDMAETTTSDLLVSCSPGISFRRRRKVTDRLHVGKAMNSTPERTVVVCSMKALYVLMIQERRSIRKQNPNIHWLLKISESRESVNYKSDHSDSGQSKEAKKK